ncbi:HAD family hydrolase [Rhodoferax antarcticus]|uniref:HAD family hydrolase n=1 Tax=Rhodoferax antarcticus TaxID=81479 RepID=UPI0022253468|nr:HAD family phosphatase [Rhodoferax antarcticus]MCW2310852.1 HAD superfamily hydrolase (TIGR01509 family) [Rhodoferax antarcticus]
MNFKAILFDCDGVLVDSEAITCGALRDQLEASGWRMTLAECMAYFVGKAVRDERVVIEARTGQPLTEAWMQAFYAQRDQALRADLQIIPGALAAVQAAQAHTGGQTACASGADRFKVEMMLSQVGLMDFFAGRIFSGHEMPRSKPAPDVYLAAAAHLQVPGSECLVIEDTTVGVTAGVAAAATVWAYCPLPDAGAALLQAGASRLFSRMSDLPELLLAR